MVINNILSAPRTGNCAGIVFPIAQMRSRLLRQRARGVRFFDAVRLTTAVSLAFPLDVFCDGGGKGAEDRPEVVDNMPCVLIIEGIRWPRCQPHRPMICMLTPNLRK